MFCILLVEDELHTREVLRDLLKEVLTSALIDTASTVEEGRQKIKVAASDNRPFDVAILDFKLPVGKGEYPEFDESLCEEIRDKMPEALVIHITRYHEESFVTSHISAYHTGKNAPRVELIQKTDKWSEKLLSEIKAYLIQQQLYSLFEKQAKATEARKVVGSSGSLTHALAALSRDIEAYWHDLDDATKARIREYFETTEVETTEDKQQVRIGLRLRR